MSTPKTIKLLFMSAKVMPIHPDPVPISHNIEPSGKLKLLTTSIRISVSILGISTL